MQNSIIGSKETTEENSLVNSLLLAKKALHVVLWETERCEKAHKIMSTDIL